MSRGDDQSPGTAYDRIAATIRAQILSGELKPGDQLATGPELSAQHQVSLNTARGALVSLTSQGLVTLRRGVSGGAFVTVPSTEKVSDFLHASLAVMADSEHISISALTEIREILEVPAAELAALRRTEEELAAIQDALFDPRAIDPTTAYSVSRSFHSRVLDAAHNPMFGLVAEPVFQVLQERFTRDRWSTSVWRRVDREHREILSFLRAGDQAGAREATRYHLRSTKGTYERVSQRST